MAPLILPNRKIPCLALIVLGLHISSGLFGAGIDSINAVSVARNFYLSHFLDASHLKKAGSEEFTFSLVHREYGQEDNSTLVKSGSVSSPLYYVFDVGEEDGYVVVAGDDRIPAVLACSFQGSYSRGNQAPAFLDWMDNYKAQISFIMDNDLEESSDITEMWDRYGTDQGTPAPLAVEDVSPLIQSHWNQGCFYNTYCPEDPGGPCDHTLVGCVAMAMAQIIQYWEHPVYVEQIPGYTHSTYGQIDEINQISYNWAAKTNSLGSVSTSQEIEAVAGLLYHCGVSVQMDYGPDGSSAYSGRAYTAFRNIFHYSDASVYISRGSYSGTGWEEMLRTELDNGRPVYYRGNNVSDGGHAFICDGYMGSDYFHFNWGWGGSQDGYFYLDPLHENVIEYNENQWAIMGIMPDSDPCNNIIPIYGCGPGHTQTFSSESGSGIRDLSLCGFEARGTEQVYRFVAPVSGIYSIELTATGDPVLYGWSMACSPEEWNCIGNLSDQQGSYGTMNWTEGETYFILLKGLDDTPETHQFYIHCPEDTPPDLQLDYYLIDDDSEGESSGDGDGLIEPGETIELTFWIFNNGPGGADDVEVLVETGQEDIQFWNPDIFIGTIPAGDSRSGIEKITFTVQEDCPEGDIIFHLNGSSVQADWNAQLTLHIYPPPPDPCDYILPIPGCGPEHSQSFSGVSGTGIWDLNLCGQEASGPERVYSFTAPETGTYRIELTSPGSRMLYGWNTVCSPDGWTCMDELSEQTGSYGSMEWTAGNTYYILVKGLASAPETQQFHITCPEPPALPQLGIFNQELDDNLNQSGDNDGVPEPGENIKMYLWLNNTGEGDAHDVSAGLTTDDPHITISDSEELFGFVPSGEYKKGPDGFVLTISEECPGKEIRFDLEIQSEEGVWTDQITFTVITGIHPDIERENRLLVYPNPAENLVFLESRYSLETPLKIELTDNNGRRLLVTELDQIHAGDAIGIDISDFSSGVYILSVAYSENRIYQKLIKLQ
ncbi:MAG: thiol protease/hemagglutinin PrtT [Bacteroidales bacterium]|nr:thiol protease/hemagglutinin PrtT [Bacteroidales bacterium]